MHVDLIPESGVVAALALRGMSLVGMAVRLRWQRHHEDERTRMVVGLACSLPPGGQVEERCADGSRLKISHKTDQDEGRCYG
jgi:hypothetical protein